MSLVDDINVRCDSSRDNNMIVNDEHRSRYYKRALSTFFSRRKIKHHHIERLITSSLERTCLVATIHIDTQSLFIHRKIRYYRGVVETLLAGAAGALADCDAAFIRSHSFNILLLSPA